MEYYVFGSTNRNGRETESLKTVSPAHTDLTGRCVLSQKLINGATREDHFRVVEKYHSAESGGNCYDWYAVDEHYTSISGAAAQGDVQELHEALDMILTGYTGEEDTSEAGTEGENPGV